MATIVWASAASARTERFRWIQPSGSTVDNFKLYMGTSSGSYPSTVTVGIPPKDSTGAYYYDVVVADSATVYATVTAWSGGLESSRSNEISRAPVSGGGGTTPPPPTASAAITGFALWNAQNDTKIDASFQNGEAIPDSVRSCAAIEILTNSYLTASGPGSVKKVLDGSSTSCSGSAVENAHPYGWEAGETGPLFPCASSLSAVGSHTLTVTPYDGDNCSGNAGTSVTLTFTVSGSGSGSGGTTLGAPGQPYIVP